MTGILGNVQPAHQKARHVLWRRHVISVRGRVAGTGGRRSDVGGQTSEVGGQRSEVGDRKSEVEKMENQKVRRLEVKKKTNLLIFLISYLLVNTTIYPIRMATSEKLALSLTKFDKNC